MPELIFFFINDNKCKRNYNLWSQGSKVQKKKLLLKKIEQERPRKFLWKNPFTGLLYTVNILKRGAPTPLGSVREFIELVSQLKMHMLQKLTKKSNLSEFGAGFIFFQSWNSSDLYGLKHTRLACGSDIRNRNDQVPRFHHTTSFQQRESETEVDLHIL